MLLTVILLQGTFTLSVYAHAGRTKAEKLRIELLSMREKNASTREELADSGELGHNRYHPEIKKVHESNNSRIREIITHIGWPTESIVREDGADAAWLIVQHAILESEFQKSALAF